MSADVGTNGVAAATLSFMCHLEAMEQGVPKKINTTFPGAANVSPATRF
jgi:hypothetical protein